MSSLDDIVASPLFLVGVAFGLVGLLQMAAGFVVLFRRQPIGFAVRLLIGLAVTAIGAMATVIAVGMRGYQALTHETVAARIAVKPSGPQRFDARVRFPDGRVSGYVIAGDELYVDAHILKWKPIANILGVHTAYELDRIAGRYRSVDQERTALRTVYPLGEPRALDLFSLRGRTAWLAPLYDAEYGSASFVPVDRPMDLEVRVSTTGLLIREAKP
ncbi:MAG: hypothetical protein ACM36B_14170 [Bacteroidota bacterium]|nr:hypothetical protein [Burkholderiales bacterium]